jgi:hypothetical protein
MVACRNHPVCSCGRLGAVLLVCLKNCPDCSGGIGPGRVLPTALRARCLVCVVCCLGWYGSPFFIIELIRIEQGII